MKALILLLCAVPCFATTYYVANAGNDACNGTSSTIGSSGACAWQTIAHVNAQTFSPGDQILFNSGDTWREQLIVPSSGTSGNPITFSAYGTGSLPTLSGAALMTGATWTQVDGGGSAADILYENFNDNQFNGYQYSFAAYGLGGPASPYWVHTGAGIIAQNGRAEITVDGTNTTPYRLYTPTNSSTSLGNVYNEAWCSFDLTWASITSASGNNIQGFGMKDQGNANKAVILGAKNVSGVNDYMYTYTTDSGQAQATLSAITTGNTDRIVFHFKRASSNASADGVVQIWINGTQALSATNVQNFNTTFGSFQLGNNFRTVMNATYYVDNLKIGSTGSAVVPAATPSNVWTTAMASQPQVLVFNGSAYGLRWPTRQYLTGNYTWNWEDGGGSGTGTLYAYATSDPGSYYSSIEYENLPQVVSTSGHSWIVIDSLHLTQGIEGVYFTGGNQSNNIIQNCLIENSREYNVVANSANVVSNITIKNSTSQRAGSFGITSSNEDGWVITGNVSYRDALVFSMFYLPSGDINFNWGGGLQHFGTGNTTISNNTVSYTAVRDDGAVLGSEKCCGIWLDTVVSGTVSGNVVHHSAWVGMALEKSRNTLWYNDLSYSNGYYGLRVHPDIGTSVPAVHDNALYGMTLYGNGVAGLVNEGGYGLAAGSNYNNTFQNTISAANGSYQLLARFGGENDGTYGSGNVYTYDDFGPPGSNFIMWGSGAFDSTYSAWEAATGNCGSAGCSHSLQVDPQFMNPGSANFALTSTSPARNAGLAISGFPFSYGAPDLGAIPYYAKAANSLVF